MKLFSGSWWWVCAGLFFLVCSSYGAMSGRDLAREQKIEDELRRVDPALIQPFHEANADLDASKYAEARVLYQAVHDRAPTFEPALRRLGACLCLLGNRPEGLNLCRQAVALHRSEPNLAALAFNLAAIRGGTASEMEKREAQRLLHEARALPDGADLSDLSASAQISLQLRDIDEFKAVETDLRQHFPDTLQTHYFAAIRAAVDENWIRAEREINRAHALGLPDGATQQFLESGVRNKAMGWKLAIAGAGVIGVWLLGLGGLFSLGFILSRLTLRSAEKADPNETMSERERRMRQIYRVVLNAAGIYYYLSLPVVMAMVIGAFAAVTFLCLSMGWIPIKLIAILGIGAIVTVVTMIRSLFLKASAQEPGRALKREEAPGLWDLVEDVARNLNTRPIDEIQITPGTDLAVFERGSWRKKMRDEGRRILILGTGVLHGFRLSHFQSVLAHEYGHFSHRDTAGGDIALRVRNDMLKFYYAMLRAGQATKLNVAFHFLRAYNFIFRRISHGATRLQEILADRVAAQAYGTLAFEQGLKHVIRRNLEFTQIANREIAEVIKSRQPLQHLYETTLTDGTSLEKEYTEALERPTTEDDTHPSPKDRFRLIAALRSEAGEEKSGEVWDLFSDREAIKREMLAKVEQQIARYRK